VTFSDLYGPRFARAACMIASLTALILCSSDIVGDVRIPRRRLTISVFVIIQRKEERLLLQPLPREVIRQRSV